ncbi:hypothetical protein [Nostoc sp. 'Peltigera malacea cyanobiont' DB3992]|uniref:hypothetical protein n=1 Tax=Nostoc sp. 'Peltigera malacea cyanobiont' DB3992 TaxID=1206980 RepID=UPI00211E59CA|nr:hypothetical protein [Nostoc sp. 'Peltigera malacea cyanobiont' DB3992]
MALIKEIVQEALTIGYLSVVAEDQLRSQLQSNYDSEDLDAWIILQRAIAAGDVKQESRRKKLPHLLKPRTFIKYQTCLSNGSRTRLCSSCSSDNDKKSKDQPSLGAIK